MTRSPSVVPSQWVESSHPLHHTSTSFITPDSSSSQLATRGEGERGGGGEGGRGEGEREREGRREGEREGGRKGGREGEKEREKRGERERDVISVTQKQKNVMLATYIHNVCAYGCCVS